MLNFLKKYCYNICIVSVYTLLACLVYGVWSYSLWQLWYVTLIIILAFIAIGVVFGYFWILNLKKKENL